MMIPRRAMALPKAAVLYVILATVAASTPLATATSNHERTSNNLRSGATHNGGRWLTYACNSKNNGNDNNRRLLERILTHPCSSHPQKSTTNELYNKNTTKGSNSFLDISLGIITGIMALLGILFLIDRETFTQLTGMTCAKRFIDPEEDSAAGGEYSNEPTPYEQDVYLTESTREYLENKHDKEILRPRRIIHSILRKVNCCFKTKDYGDEDKYNIPWTGSEDEKNDVNICLVIWEEIRLRLFWKPTKNYDERDKYDVGEKEEDEYYGKDVEIKIAASSYESAEAGTTPW